MELTLRQTGDTLVVSFPRRVNLEGDASVAFKDRLRELSCKGGAHVVVDLSNVAFIDSQGLGALISTLKLLRGAEGSLSLTNLTQPVEAVLRVTRLDRVFDVFPAVDDAVAAAATPRPSSMAGHGA